MASSTLATAGRFALSSSAGAGAGAGSSGVANSHELARQRQQFPPASTPGSEYPPQPSNYHSDVKDTQHVPSSLYESSAYPSYRSSQQSNGSIMSSKDAETPLSSFLARSFAQAKHSITSSTTKPSAPSSETPLVQSALSSVRESVPFILLCSAWYMSSAMSSNTGKSILTRFRYPVTLTIVQFAFVASYCVVILAVRERVAVSSASTGGGGLTSRRGSMPIKGFGIRKPSRAMFQGTLMMSLFQIAGHVFSSMAIARVPVSTVHTIKALSPLFTVMAYAMLFRVSYSSATYLALLPLTVGVMLACSFDLRANAVGFLCALGSTLVFVSQNIFSKKLLPKESSTGAHVNTGGPNSGKLDKLNLLFYSSGMAFVLMIPIWLYSDGSALLFRPTPPALANAPPGTAASLAFNFFLNGTVHFAQNLIAFSILARTSPVTYSIASLVKRIAVICIAIIWSGQKVTLLQGMGMTMTFGGLWMYNRAKSDVDKGERKRGQVEKRQEMFLPTTAGDARDLNTPTPPPGGLGIFTQVGGGPNSVPAPYSNGLGHVPPPPHASQYVVPVVPAPGSHPHLSPSQGQPTAHPPNASHVMPPRPQQNRFEVPLSTAVSRGLQPAPENPPGRRSWEGSAVHHSVTSPRISAATMPPAPVQSSVRYL
ncbi:BZ3500_MvSof-1268-A1-R1_Chr6-3g08862 [Microbotryum saponariae]|uniref:BZ3500_MvSof-1268-A1-R1_Chr6-3g08862 protein n=1 Tax=Microbotryum saponariae TaxID=289078 RepID=A0A2X0M5Y8_9BASI|nr:BZ3500_MvSof-1268-A1-R1_Chr6-3g08862 [Microbotryum saponariae]SDA07463.1 BZ3501_MvSof-1269-A2-R1_Chr6-2g08565 [Microbotryum saponariae]